jgi:2-C-methyl-D-erythritol 2,4-cyclodiphosphate synthase
MTPKKNKPTRKSRSVSSPQTRIGFGYDVHRLVEGRALILGAVTIPHSKGLLGHSDADVLLHAICDALLGAAALGDIGKLFPDNDPRFKDANSLILLSQVAALLKKGKFVVGNIDSTVVLQSPKIAEFVPQMVSNIAGTLKISTGAVSVKATTNEGLGFLGAEEGCASYAVAMIYTT